MDWGWRTGAFRRLNWKQCSKIGAGSVVTKDILDNVIAVGNPCQELRAIANEKRICI